ncbi:alpha-L-fucosidase [Parapedobacter sp.]
MEKISKKTTYYPLFILFIGLAWFVLPSKMVLAQSTARDSVILKHGAHRLGKRTDEAMQRWRAYGLGQFIHWGVYAIPGGEWNGAKYRGAAEWIRSWSTHSGAPENWHQTYDNLYKSFNPTDFDAKAWAKQAKEMGARYMIFTTKHHDGFCLWPSKYTDYTIMESPYKQDIVKAVVDAYHAEGIDVYLYFSIIDWNHPGYRSSAPTTDAERKRYEEFKTFTKNQLMELLTNYPTIKGLWFDGTWDAAWVAEAAWADQLETELRASHPGLIIGSRFRADENGKRHFDTNGNLIGDYEQGWERKLPQTYDQVKGNDWDCVMTIPPNQWGYHKDWNDAYIKTPYDLIQMTLHAVSMDGNMVINFGPDGKGNIRPEETEIAAEIGKWMDINGEAVYGTAHAELPSSPYGYLTKREDTIYLTVFNKPINNVLRIVVPKNAKQVPLQASLLDGGEVLKLIHQQIGLDRDPNTYFDVVLPTGLHASGPFVVKIQLSKSEGEEKGFGDAKT